MNLLAASLGSETDAEIRLNFAHRLCKLDKGKTRSKDRGILLVFLMALLKHWFGTLYGKSPKLL